MTDYQWAVMQANLDPAIGTEQRGAHPVLIISNEDFNQIVPNVTVLPLTSTQRRLYPSEVKIPVGIAGQPLDSIIMAHQIKTISKQRLGKITGHLNDEMIRNEIQTAIKEHLDLD